MVACVSRQTLGCARTGRFASDHTGEQPGIVLIWERTDTGVRLTADGAREAAAALVAAADELDGLEGTGSS